MREALAVLLPACAVAVLLLPRRLRWSSSLAAAAIAIGLGLGFSSLVSTALIAAGIAATSIGFVAIDAAIWVSVAALGWWLRTRKESTPAQFPTPHAQGSERNTERTTSEADLTDWVLRIAFGAASES